MATMKLKVENGALLEAPKWSSHKRSHNWCAEIALDPRAPGGIARKFWERARGDYFYMVPADLLAGTPLEFAADYYSGSGRKSPDRWYGFVIAVNTKAVEVKTCDGYREAIEEARAFTASIGASDLE